MPLMPEVNHCELCYALVIFTYILMITSHYIMYRSSALENMIYISKEYILVESDQNTK